MSNFKLLVAILLCLAPSTVLAAKRELIGGRVGAGYDLRLPGSGGLPPYHWRVTGGQLPPGIALDENSGELRSSELTTQGDYSFTVEFGDAAGSKPVQEELAIRVLPRQTGLQPLRILPDVLPRAIKGQAYKVYIAVTGGVAPVQCAIEGKLPAGLRLDGALCSMSGTPSEEATVNLRVIARDAQESPAQVSREYKVEVLAPPRSPWLLIALAVLGTLLAVGLFMWWRKRRKALTCWIRNPKPCLGYPIRWVSSDTYVCPKCGRRKWITNLVID